MKISFANASAPRKGTVIVFATDGAAWTKTAEALDKKLGGALGRAAKTANFEGKKSQTMSVLSPGNGAIDRVLCVGLGKADELTPEKATEIGGAIYGALKKAAGAADVHVDAVTESKQTAAEIASAMAFGATLRSYEFAKYKKKKKKKKKK